MKPLMLLVLLLLSLPFSITVGQETDGLWETEGYGYVIAFDDGLITLYEVTEVSCLLIYEGDRAALAWDFSFENDTLIVTSADPQFYVNTHSLSELPPQCANGGTPESDDPALNFDVFWHTFNEHYAFFDLHGVDWQASYDLYHPQLKSEMTPVELLEIFVPMILPLDDDNVTVDTLIQTIEPANGPMWVADIFDEMNILAKAAQVIAEGYLHTLVTYEPIEFQLSGDNVAGGEIFYGSLSDQVGYINILAMLPPADGLEGATTAIDEVIEALEEKDTIIVDLRFSMRGWDAIALIFASRFADEQRLAYSEQTRDRNGFTPLREFYVTPEGAKQFTGRVILLTSQYTAGAAESFVMALKSFPYVTTIGETTAGAHSDALVRRLPNGWYVTLSNQITYASDGSIYELVGLSPDVEIPFRPELLDEGTDNILDAVLADL
jgi:carboxyl-terminal processing protease